MGEVGRVLDVMNVVDNKWEVDFSGKTLLLRRDEMELVGDFDEISKQAQEGYDSGNFILSKCC